MKAKIIITLFVLVSSINLIAQKTLATTGGDAKGTGGSADITLGNKNI